MEGKVDCSISFSVSGVYVVIGNLGGVFKLVNAVLVMSVVFRNNSLYLLPFGEDDLLEDAAPSTGLALVSFRPSAGSAAFGHP